MSAAKPFFTCDKMTVFTNSVDIFNSPSQIMQHKNHHLHLADKEKYKAA